MRPIILTLAFIFSSVSLLNAQEYEIGDLHPEGGVVASTNKMQLQLVLFSKELTPIGYEEALKFYNHQKPASNTWQMIDAGSIAFLYGYIRSPKFDRSFLKDGKYWVTNSFTDKLKFNDEDFNNTHCYVVTIEDGNLIVGGEVNKKNEKAFLLQVLHPRYNYKGAAVTNILEPGRILKPGDKLISANAAYILTLQEDGNLCIYNYKNGVQGAYVWGTQKYGFKDARCQLNANGDFIVYTGKNDIQWSSATGKDRYSNPSKLVLENDGSLRLYNAGGKVVWRNK